MQALVMDNAEGFYGKQLRSKQFAFENGGTGDAASSKSNMRATSGQNFPHGQHGKKQLANHHSIDDNQSMRSIHTENRAYKQMLAGQVGDQGEGRPSSTSALKLSK